MLTRLLPPDVVTAEAGEPDWTAPLRPEEEPAVARAVEHRRREFAAGRACARRALGTLGCGIEGVAIPTGVEREPVWPAGVVGSITHCDGYCAAAVARAGEVRALGIDAELRAPLPAGVVELVCTPAERRHLERLGGDHWALVVFSAKESIYKAWFPIERRWLDHQDAELSIDPKRGTFRARIRAAPPWSELEGRFAMDADRVYTAVALPAP